MRNHTGHEAGCMWNPGEGRGINGIKPLLAAALAGGRQSLVTPSEHDQIHSWIVRHQTATPMGVGFTRHITTLAVGTVSGSRNQFSCSPGWTWGGGEPSSRQLIRPVEQPPKSLGRQNAPDPGSEIRSRACCSRWMVDPLTHWLRAHRHADIRSEVVAIGPWSQQAAPLVPVACSAPSLEWDRLVSSERGFRGR